MNSKLPTSREFCMDLLDSNNHLNNISVIICAKNAEASLDRCLRSVRRISVKEVIVIDGVSSDNTKRIALTHNVKIYSDEGRGLGYARQLGAEMASGEYIAYIDADTELPSENILLTMRKELKRENWAAIHAQLIDPMEHKTYWEKGEDFHERKIFNVSGEKKVLGTVVCLIRRGIILTYKFDQFFSGAAEDRDFYYRIGKQGHKIGASTAVAYHYHRTSFEDFVKQKIWYGKGNARIAWKHSNHIPLALTSPFLIIMFGMLLSFRYEMKLIPFFLVWGFSLLIGTAMGFLEIVREVY